MAQDQDRHGNGQFKSDDTPPVLNGTLPYIGKEPSGGAPGKSLGRNNTYVKDYEYSSSGNYDVGQQDTDKSRSR
jgi:hypothetical protein